MTTAPLPGEAEVRAAPLATWKALTLACLAIVLAVALVVGQLLVAHARGIDSNLSRVADNLEASNATIDAILARSSVTPRMDRRVGLIGRELDRIAVKLRRTNRSLARTSANVARLGGLTGEESASAAGMERSLAAMSGEVAQLQRLLADLVPLSRATGTELAALRSGSAAAAAGLDAITGKLTRYGLPVACPQAGRC